MLMSRNMFYKIDIKYLYNLQRTVVMGFRYKM